MTSGLGSLGMGVLAITALGIGIPMLVFGTSKHAVIAGYMACGWSLLLADLWHTRWRFGSVQAAPPLERVAFWIVLAIATVLTVFSGTIASLSLLRS